MKKPLFALLLLVLLIGSFLGGTWYNQNGSGKIHYVQEERRILHYVDPMNPANVSDKPGIAPCGMPMEPVYDDESVRAGSPDAALSMSPGTVKITPQKQQIIGVQVGAVEMASETHGIRTLGRIVPDEDRVYPLIAATDGWVWDVQGNTTGSLVEKDQLLARIKIYNYDFFTWQQRYLTELANRGQRRHPATPFTGARQSGALQPRGMAPEAMQSEKTPPEDMQPEEILSKDMQSEDMQPGAPFPEAQQPGSPQAATAQTEPLQPKGMPHVAPQPDVHQPGTSHSGTFQPEAIQPAEKQQMNKKSIMDPLNMRADEILYANKSKLEMLNLGVGEGQLEELARTARYVTYLELRSPVAGLVLERGVFPQQKVDRGTECFRVADLSRVWVVADVFNIEEQYIRPGMSARISLPGQSRSFEARVSDVPPQFNAASRTLRVRLEMDNPKNVLRPEMFVDVELLVTLPPTITVPAEAVLDSGLRKTVFVALGNGFFEPRPVVTGWRFDDRVEIVEGLMPGEQIVISGNFLIDSESRAKRAAAGLHGTPVIDPVCGVDVYPNRAKARGLTRDIEGSMYCFSSEECMALFDKEPQRFIRKGGGEKARPGAPSQRIR